jgi:hypothetical protein
MSDPSEKPPVFAPPSPPPTSPNFIDTLIPAKNGDALLSYYSGLFSIFPLLGAILGLVAIVKGRTGLQKTKADPHLPGATHARVGIGCGLIGLLFNLGLIGLLIAALLSRPGN